MVFRQKDVNDKVLSSRGRKPSRLHQISCVYILNSVSLPACYYERDSLVHRLNFVGTPGLVTENWDFPRKIGTYQSPAEQRRQQCRW
jgi:hypothetical protein